MTYNFYLNPNKNSDERSIFLYIREDDKTIMLNTGIKISEKSWDKKKQRVKKLANDLHHTFNRQLDLKKANIIKEISNLKDLDPDISFAEIKMHFKNIKERTNTFFGLLDKYIKTQGGRVSKGTIQKYEQLRTKLQNFETTIKYPLELDILKPMVLDEFGTFLIKKWGLQTNSAVKVQKTLMGFLNWAYTNGFTKNYFPYKYMTQYKPIKIALTEDELKQFEEAELNDKLTRVRDIFLFQTYTGQRFIDIKDFNKNQIHKTKKGNLYRKLVQHKGTTFIETPICTKARVILEKYDFNLPLISNVKMNKYLKEIGELLEINQVETNIKFYGKRRETIEQPRYMNIETHTARRTFITLCHYAGINENLINSISGQGERSIQERYIKMQHDKSIQLLDVVFS